MRINPDILTDVAATMGGSCIITTPGPEASDDVLAVFVADNPLKEKQLSIEVPDWAVRWIDATLSGYLKLFDRESVYDLALDRVFNEPVSIISPTEKERDLGQYQLLVAEHTAFYRLADLANTASFPAPYWLSFEQADVRFTVPYSFLAIMTEALSIAGALPGINKEALHSFLPHRRYSLSSVLKDVSVCLGILLKLYKPRQPKRNHAMKGKN